MQPVLEHLVHSPWSSNKVNGLRLVVCISPSPKIAYNGSDLSLSTCMALPSKPKKSCHSLLEVLYRH